MYFRAIAGMVAGLAAGAVSGVMYLIMSVPDIYGETTPLLSLIAQAVGSNDAAVGWSFNLFCSTVVGVLFALVYGSSVRTMTRALLSGLVTGLFFWVVSAMVMLPVLDATMAVFAPFTTPAVRPLATGLLIGSCVFGMLMGAVFLLLYRPIDIEERKLAQREAEEKLLYEDQFSSVR